MRWWERDFFDSYFFLFHINQLKHKTITFQSQSRSIYANDNNNSSTFNMQANSSAAAKFSLDLTDESQCQSKEAWPADYVKSEFAHLERYLDSNQLKSILFYIISNSTWRHECRWQFTQAKKQRLESAAVEWRRWFRWRKFAGAAG